MELFWPPHRIICLCNVKFIKHAMDVLYHLDEEYCNVMYIHYINKLFTYSIM